MILYAGSAPSGVRRRRTIGGMQEAARLVREGVPHLPGVIRAQTELAPRAADGSRSDAAVAPSYTAPASCAGWYARGGKRALDIGLGLLLLAMLLPLVAVIALAVLIVGGPPVFYASERAGQGGSRFLMWKFRTMAADADAQYETWKQTHPARAAELSTHWKLHRDPRVTVLGRILRKSSLDELPQFWNVLRGEMSLVGPRPYLPRETMDPAMAEAIRAVRPGLTGPFQVRGRKGLSPTSRMQIEAAYGAQMSLLGDLGYVLRTVQPLLKLDGR